MKNQWYFQFCSVLFSLVLLFPYSVAAFDPSVPPGSTSSYTLGDICARLDSGVDRIPSNFSEPTSVQGSIVHCTLNKIIAKAPEKDNISGAQPSDVVKGKTYWGLTKGYWGVQTGTAVPLTIAKTGVTTSQKSGDDGDWQKGVTVVGPRFTDNEDGTVTDNLTGLIWLKYANCVGTYRDWTTALSDVVQLNTNGTMNENDCSDIGSQTDWRLPNVKELQSLIDFSNENPALPRGHPFLDVQMGVYWSSTPDVSYTTDVWAINLSYGNVNSSNKTDTNYVWAVRGGN